MPDYSSLWRMKVMKKGKKRHWGFTCPQCNKKFSSKSHTQYYFIAHYDLGMVYEGFSTDYEVMRFCSEICVLNHLEDKNIEPEEAVRKIKEYWEYVDLVMK